MEIVSCDENITIHHAPLSLPFFGFREITQRQKTLGDDLCGRD